MFLHTINNAIYAHVKPSFMTFNLTIFRMDGTFNYEVNTHAHYTKTRAPKDVSSLNISKKQVRNPLGIVALFISLIYGFASLLLGSSAEKLESIERWPIILFIVIFPFSVLYVFYKLVTEHHGKLYSPGDYKADDSFLKTHTVQELEAKLEEEVDEVVALESTNLSLYEADDIRKNIKNKISKAENFVIKEVEKELGIKPKTGIKISQDLYVFDAGYITPKISATMLEVKYYSSAVIHLKTINEFLQRAKLTDDYMSFKTNFIVALVIESDSDSFNMVINKWKNIIKNSGLDIEVRTYIGSKIQA
jgi:hypothetical protein